MWKVEGSGIAIMSDSSIGLNPVIEDPSKPMPPSNASSSSAALIEKLFNWPRMSVNQRRMNRTSRSFTMLMTSWAVFGALSATATAPSWRGRRAPYPTPDRLAARQYCSHSHAHERIAVTAGSSARPLGVSAYSTRTGGSS